MTVAVDDKLWNFLLGKDITNENIVPADIFNENVISEMKKLKIVKYIDCNGNAILVDSVTSEKITVKKTDNNIE